MAIEQWGGGGGLLSSGGDRQAVRAEKALVAETAFQGQLIDAHAELAGRSMDRTADLYQYAIGLAGSDDQLRAALMGEVAGFINRSQSVQRTFGRR